MLSTIIRHGLLRRCGIQNFESRCPKCAEVFAQTLSRFIVSTAIWWHSYHMRHFGIWPRPHYEYIDTANHNAIAYPLEAHGLANLGQFRGFCCTVNIFSVDKGTDRTKQGAWRVLPHPEHPFSWFRHNLGRGLRESHAPYSPLKISRANKNCAMHEQDMHHINESLNMPGFVILKPNKSQHVPYCLFFAWPTCENSNSSRCSMHTDKALNSRMDGCPLPSCSRSALYMQCSDVFRA